MSLRINAIDLFCGAGGLTHGLDKAGVNVVAGIDLDSECKFAYESNNTAKFLEKDVATVSGSKIRSLFGRADYTLLAGCAPCQPFSSYSNGSSGAKDGRWRLLDEFARLISEAKPDVITMENVPQLRLKPIFRRFVSTLKALGYQVNTHVADCSSFGVPQRRQRLVLIASKYGQVKLEPAGDPGTTVRDAIGHLPPIRAGEAAETDPLHRASKLSALNLRRIKASRPGGSWREWPDDLVAKCHTKESGSSYEAVYGRMNFDMPSPTMTTLCYGFGNGRFGHPVQDRGISLREAALIQSFPADYKFFPDGDQANMRSGGRMIGNAVPPKLGEAIGNAIVRHLEAVKLQSKTKSRPKITRSVRLR